jgi:hypothetical protein
MRLPVPRHVQAASVAMGVGTIVLGIAYATSSVYRRPELEDRSVVALIERPLGWLMIAVGVWVVIAAVIRHTRASAHAVAAVMHGGYLAAMAATFFLAFPYQSAAGVALALFPFVAHGGCAIDYWSRGYR